MSKESITDIRTNVNESEDKAVHTEEEIKTPELVYTEEKFDIDIPEFLSKKNKQVSYPLVSQEEAISLMITKPIMYGLIIVALFFGIFSGTMVTSLVYQNKINDLNTLHTQQLLDNKSKVDSLSKELNDSKVANLALANKIAFQNTAKVYPAVKRTVTQVAYTNSLNKLHKLASYKNAPTFVKKFLDKSVPQAIAASKKTGNKYPSIALAQAIDESGYGRNAIGGSNIFGMKGSSSRGGVIVRSKEYIKGKYVVKSSKFQRFNSYEEAFIAHAKNLLRHPAYKKYRKADTYKEAACALQGTYASSPVYASKLINIIKQYHLYELDKELQGLL